MTRVAFSFFALLLASGCASQSYSPRIDYVGKYRAQAVNEVAADVTDAEAADVEVLLNELPPGVTLTQARWRSRPIVRGPSSPKPAPIPTEGGCVG
jgi:hypothetical protein